MRFFEIQNGDDALDHDAPLSRCDQGRSIARIGAEEGAARFDLAQPGSAGILARQGIGGRFLRIRQCDRFQTQTEQADNLSENGTRDHGEAGHQSRRRNPDWNADMRTGRSHSTVAKTEQR